MLVFHRVPQAANCTRGRPRAAGRGARAKSMQSWKNALVQTTVHMGVRLTVQRTGCFRVSRSRCEA